MVSNEKLPHIQYLYDYKGIKEFINDIDFLARLFDPISLTDLIEKSKRGSKIKSNLFLLTFDDGYKEMYTIVAPILRRKGIPAVFFLNTDFIDNKDLSYINKASLIINILKKKPELVKQFNRVFDCLKNLSEEEVFKKILSIGYRRRSLLDQMAKVADVDFNEFLKTYQPYLNRSQIISMINDGFYFGAHSKDHPHYSEISLEEQIDQTLESLKIIKNEFNLIYSVFAFPFGAEGVSLEFFQCIMNKVDLTFSTSYCLNNNLAWNLRRINFERSLLPAKMIVSRYMAKDLVYSIFQGSKK